MDLRTDPAGILADQLRQSAELSQQRMTGLSDDEFLWEPVKGMWSIRRRGDERTPHAFGPGEWVTDFERIDPFQPGPLTTIAWRVGHLNAMFAGRYEWTFGNRETPPDAVVDFSPLAETALTQLWGWVERWTGAVELAAPEELEMTGFGQYPWGLDPDIPLLGVCWWVNREFIHHMAEVALLRDLYARRSELQVP